MITLENKPYILFFTELGEYNNLTKEFRKLKEAKKYQSDLIKEASNSDPEFGYFTYIAKIIEIRRKESNESEQTKTFPHNGELKSK